MKVKTGGTCTGKGGGIQPQGQGLGGTPGKGSGRGLHSQTDSLFLEKADGAELRGRGDAEEVRLTPDPVLDFPSLPSCISPTSPPPGRLPGYPVWVVFL